MKTMNKKRTRVLAVMVALLMVMQYSLFGTLTVNAADEEVGKTIASTLSVKYHFFAKNADGNYGEVRSLSRSVKTGGNTTNITATTANGYVSPKSVAIGDKTYDFSNSWNYGNGSAAAFPLSMSYDEAAGLTQDGKTVDVNLYAQYEQRKMPVKVTIHFAGIKQANGTEKNTSTSNNISWGGGWNFTKKKLESTTGVVSGQSFSYGGCTYSYTGQWKDGNGNIIDGSQTISLKYSNGASAGNTYYISEDTDLYFSPVYDVTTVNGLDLSYIDRVSTGSGSWSNKASDGTRSPFTTMTHTFKQPDAKAHYKFVEWKDFDASKSYQAGEAFSYTLGNEPANDPVKTVNIYALWQPSVTVNYNVLGKTVKAEESFDKVAVYDYEPESKGANIEFTGWFDANGNRIDGLTVYEAPEVTGADEAVASPEVKDDDNGGRKTSKATLVAGTDKGGSNGGAGSTEGSTDGALIADSDTPLAQIADDEAPLGVNNGAWALVNLIAMIITVIIGLAAAVMGFFGRNKEDDEDETEEKLKRRIPARILAAAAAVISVIVFILTEDMSLPMQMTDNWTIWMIIILAAGAAAAVISKKKYDEEEKEDRGVARA